MQVMSKPPNIIKTLGKFASRDGEYRHRRIHAFKLIDPGIPSLWTGVTASWLRQSVYSTTRFGLNGYFVDKAKKHSGQERLSSSWEILCAGASGGLAGLVGNPTEVFLSGLR